MKTPPTVQDALEQLRAAVAQEQTQTLLVRLQANFGATTELLPKNGRTAGRRKMSAATKAKMAASARRRWAKKKSPK